MKAYERLIEYVKIATPSDENSETHPTSQCQFELATRLAEELKTEGKATLRTDYSLDDEGFSEIAQQVISRYGGGELAGCYWMGVIYLSDE